MENFSTIRAGVQRPFQKTYEGLHYPHHTLQSMGMESWWGRSDFGSDSDSGFLIDSDSIRNLK